MVVKEAGVYEGDESIVKEVDIVEEEKEKVAEKEKAEAK